MQQLDNVGQNVEKHGASVGSRFAARVQTGLGKLDVPVAVAIPDEVIQLGNRNADVKMLHVFGHFLDQGIEPVENPLVLKLELFGNARHIAVLNIHHDKA